MIKPNEPVVADKGAKREHDNMMNLLSIIKSKLLKKGQA